MANPAIWVVFLFVAFSPICFLEAKRICIIGSGISGASAAFFLTNYSSSDLRIDIFEQRNVVGGRIAMVDLEGDRFEAGASIIHSKNLHAVRFAKLLGLKQKISADESSWGFWNGKSFVFKTWKANGSIFWNKFIDFINSLALIWRYQTSLLKMKAYVSDLLEKFLHFYDEERPPFETVEELLKSVNLYNPTQKSLFDELSQKGISLSLITELVTVITRVNYGQNVSISGLAGGVALCGSGNELWSVEGGNWQIPKGLIELSNATLYLNETVSSVSSKDGKYEVSTSRGNIGTYDAVVIAGSLDENSISFTPSISIPKRHMQHTFVTFVRGLLSPMYFGENSVEDLPDFIGTLEIPGLPFSSISELKKYDELDRAYKVFSRAVLSDKFLDELFSVRRRTIQLDWAAYPHYKVPETFASIILDQNQLYYINSFENAASTIETSAVAAENVARLLISRLLNDSFNHMENINLQKFPGIHTLDDL